MSARTVLEKWSRETIQHAPFGNVDGYGQRTYGASVARKARIDYRTKLVQDQFGEQRVSTTQVYIATTDAIGVQDKITLPDGSSPLLLRVDRLADVQGSAWMATCYF